MQSFSLFVAVLLLVISADALISFPKFSFRAVKGIEFGQSSPNLRQVTQLYADEQDKPIVDIEDAVKKQGFEVGMFKALSNKDAASVKPADLLKKYGAAYLITSISFAIVSYAICYLLISQGVDVAALLGKIGIEASSTANNVGTAGLAYAVHKAASPIRFPPTVALTPVVAEWLGKKSAGRDSD